MELQERLHEDLTNLSTVLGTDATAWTVPKEALTKLSGLAASGIQVAGGIGPYTEDSLNLWYNVFYKLVEDFRAEHPESFQKAVDVLSARKVLCLTSDGHLAELTALQGDLPITRDALMSLLEE